MADVDDFLERLASSDPVPGGGSVAALQVAIGGSLLMMVCGLTLGRTKYESVAPQVEEISRKASTLAETARRLVDEDAEAFDRVSKAMKLPRGSDEEKEYRRQVIQQSLKDAVQPPLHTMRLAEAGLELAQALASIGNPSAVSDVGTAALSFVAGFHGGRLNVEINLNSIKDSEFVSSIRDETPSAGSLDSKGALILQLVESEIAGNG